MSNNNNDTLILGLLRGDEGKGKITDYFADKHDMVIRFQGGPNAGHTIYKDDKKLVLHQLPSGILHGDRTINLIGHGTIIDVRKLIIEIGNVVSTFNISLSNIYLKIAKGCHVITRQHIIDDTERENSGKGNGSTKCGISPCYRDKYYREGVRLVDWWNEDNINEVKQLILQDDSISVSEDDLNQIIHFIEINMVDDTYELNYNWKNRTKLFEGAQGVFLDIDNPYYPNVSSSSVNVGGVITGTGIAYKNLKNLNIIGVVKAYMSSVGVGFFPTEIKDKLEWEYKGKKYSITADKIREVGQEYGATTGRPRKVGILDLPMVKHAVDIIGVDSICLTRLDTLQQIFPYSEYPVFPVCTGYGLKGEDGNITNLTDANNNVSWYDVLANSDKIVPIYTLMNNWLDKNYTYGAAMDLIRFINNFVGVDVEFASTGKNKSDIQTFIGLNDNKKNKEKW